MIAAERRGSYKRRANRAVIWYTRIWDASRRNGAFRKAAITSAQDMVAAAYGAVRGGGIDRLMAVGRYGILGDSA